MPHADNHDRQEHPAIDLYLTLADDGEFATPIHFNDVRRTDDGRRQWHNVDLDDPANAPTILAVLRALHDRRPDLYRRISDEHLARIPLVKLPESDDERWPGDIVRRGPPDHRQ